MESLMRKKVINKITRLLIMLLLFSFILPYYANADTEEEEKRQAVVPAAAAQVLEGITTVTAASNINTSNTSGGQVDTSTYAESGDGYDSLTTVGSRNYKNYKQYQGSYSGQSYWNGTVSSDGCGPTSAAIVASGCGIDKTPGDICSIITSKYGNQTNSVNLSSALSDIGVSNTRETASDYGSDTAIAHIKQNLQNGNPVLAGVSGATKKYSNGAHWIAVLSIDSDGDTITVSNPGRSETPQTGSLSDLVKNEILPEGSYILITQSGSNSNSNNSDNSPSNNTPSTGGQGSVIQTTNSSETGYSGIFQSGTTGRQFKEYKQNIDGWDSKYKINDLPNSSGWRSECGVVSVITVGSGYSDKATFEDVTAKLRNNSGSSALESWTNEYTSQSTTFPAYGNLMEKSEFINGLSNGCVAVVHSSSYSSNGHYMAVLDISADKKQIYLSNPWEGDSRSGWLSIDTVYSWLDAITLVTNDGSSMDYSSGGSGSSGSYSMPTLTSNISQHITENGRGGYKIDIDLDEKVDEMLDILKEQKNRDVDNFLKTSNKKDYLKAMLKAELVTQFPDLRSADEIAASGENEEQIKNIKENLPKAIEMLEIIHNTKEDLIEQKDFETEEELNTAIQNKLNEIQYETKQDGENTIYTYTKDEKNYRLEKIGKESYNLYEISGEEITEEEQYVFNSLKTENVQEKIYNILMSGRITKEAVHNYFYTTLNTVADTRGYNVEEMEDLYFSYISQTREKLADVDNNLLDWLNEIFNNNAQVPEDELQGVIRIKRKTINAETGEEGTSKYLSYIPYDEFKEKCNNTDTSVLDHFTINTSGAIIVAKWKQHIHQPIGVVGSTTSVDSQYQSLLVGTATYEITESAPLSYLSQIYQHTMPFELLWTLLVYSGDKDFIYDLTNLVFDTEITITALDSITKTSTTSSETVYGSSKEVNNAQTSGGAISSEDDADSYSYTVMYQDYYEEDNVQLKVSYIDSWIATYTNNDEVVQTEEDKDTNNLQQDGTDWEKQGETEQKDGNQAGAMVNSDSELLEQYKALIKEKVKENVKNYTNSNLDQNTLKKAKETIQNNEQLQTTYVDNIKTNDLFPFLSAVEDAFQNNPLVNGEFVLNEDTINKIKQATTDTNEQEVMKQILKDIYKTGDWKIEIKSGTTESYTKIDKVESEITTETKTYKYTTTSGQVVEKTDKNAEEDNFVKLLCEHGKAKGSLRSIASWMFESIERNQVLSDKLDLIKYLLGIAFGRNYGVDSFDFSIYDPESFQSISGSSGVSGGVVEMLKSYENEALRKYMNGESGVSYSDVSEYVTEDRKQYKMYYTSFDGCLNFSYGIMVRTSGGALNNEGYFKDEGIDLASLVSKYNSGQEALVDAEIVDRIKVKIIEDKKEDIRQAVSKRGVNLKENEVDALTMVAYQYGNCGQYIEGSQNIAEVYKTYYQKGNADGFKNNAVCQTAAGGLSHFFVTGEYPTREKYTWKLFNEGIYTLSDGTVITASASDGSIIASAEKIHTYMEQNKYVYSLSNLPTTFEESKSNKVTCCATFVSWVLRDAGYINETIHSAPGLASTLQSKYHFTKVNGSQLKAGDVMVYDGHVQIYAGNGQIYNAGSTDAIQRANPYTSNWGTLLYGLRAPN